MQVDKKIFSKLGLAYAIFFVVSLLSQVAWIILLMATGWGQQESDLIKLLTMTIPMYICAFPVLYRIFQTIPARKPTPAKSMGWGTWVVIIVICIGITCWCNLLGQGVMKGVDLLFKRPSNNQVQELILQTNPLVLFIAAVILAPIMEEIMFRKLLIDRLYQYGEGVIIIISGLMFGLAHGNLYQFFYAFALGAIFAFIYLKTGKIIYSILLHMMINFLGSMVPIFLLKLVASEHVTLSFLLIVTYMFGILAFMISSLALLAIVLPKLKLRKGIVDLSVNGGVKAIALSPGMLFFMLIGIILFIK